MKKRVPFISDQKGDTHPLWVLWKGSRAGDPPARPRVSDGGGRAPRGVCLSVCRPVRNRPARSSLRWRRVLCPGGACGAPPARGSPSVERRPRDVSSPATRAQQRFLGTGLRLPRARSSLPGSLGAETHVVDAPRVHGARVPRLGAPAASGAGGGRSPWDPAWALLRA